MLDAVATPELLKLVAAVGELLKATRRQNEAALLLGDAFTEYLKALGVEVPHLRLVKAPQVPPG